MKQRIRVAVLIVQNNKILLVKHVHPKTKFTWWVPPGGGLEAKDNSLYECAIRETWEETGYHIDTGDILYIREFADKEDMRYNLEIFIKGKIKTGYLTIKNIIGNGPDEDYIKEAKWVDKLELQEINVFPEIIKTEEFWLDYIQNKVCTKYLGKKEGIYG